VLGIGTATTFQTENIVVLGRKTKLRPRKRKAEHQMSLRIILGRVGLIPTAAAHAAYFSPQSAHRSVFSHLQGLTSAPAIAVALAARSASTLAWP
jgi:hypothetical protein